MKIKRTLVAKGIENYSVNESLAKTHLPIAGDLGLFKIIEIGKHRNAQGDQGRNVAIFPGDYLVAAFADRYATSQYEGYVPKEHRDLYHVIGAGGVIGIVHSQNASLDYIEPTKVELVGYCCNESNQIINTKFYQKTRTSFTGIVPAGMKIVLSIGSTMDSGKTTTAAHVARGLKTTGKNVGFIKFTGTAYTKDRDYVLDCGADVVGDFSDFGFPSTFMCEKEELLDLYQSLLENMAAKGVELLVMEIADGIWQRETEFLLRDKAFMKTIHSVVFSCGDSLSAIQGVKSLREMDIQPVLVSGRFTMSPLLITEVKNHLPLPVLTIDEIMTGEFNHLMLN